MTVHKHAQQASNSHQSPSASDASAESEAAGNAAAGSNLEEALEKQKEETARYKDLALRAQADFDNYRKRAAKDKEDAIRYANTSLLEKLLPILDNFELGLIAARQAIDESQKGHTPGTSITALLDGMAMVQKQIEDFLRDHGVQPIEAIGQPFDPHAHEALGHEPTEEVPEGHVARQIRRGYRIKDRLLRPSNVFVASKPNS